MIATVYKGNFTSDKKCREKDGTVKIEILFGVITVVIPIIIIITCKIVLGSFFCHLHLLNPVFFFDQRHILKNSKDHSNEKNKNGYILASFQ